MFEDIEPLTKKYTICAYVKNHFGVLTRVSGLFARRGYNIKSLTVGETQKPEESRMTIEFTGDERTRDQIISQLKKIDDVIGVESLDPNNSVLSELFLVKLRATDKNRSAILQIATVFKAKPVDISPETITFELTGRENKLNSFFENVSRFGIIEIARTGVTAIARG